MQDVLGSFLESIDLETSRQNSRMCLQFAGPYFSCQRCHQGARHRRNLGPDACEFDEELLV